MLRGTWCCLTIALLAAGSGCARNTKINQALALQPRPSTADVPLAKAAEPDVPQFAEQTPSSPQGGVDHQTFVAALAEVERLGHRDPAAQARLLDDLRHTESDLIPQLLAARQGLQPSAPEPTSQSVDPPKTPDVELVSHEEGLGAFDIAPPKKPDDRGVQTADWNPPPREPAILAEVIRQRESRIARQPATPEELRQHLELRLLYLAAGRRNDALRPIPGVDSNGQQLWRGTLEGMATYLEATQGAIPAERTKALSRQLNRVADELARQVPVEIRQLAFCRRIASFGVYEPFAGSRFSPGQEVLLYVEVDHFASRQTPEGFRSQLTCRYELLGADGKVRHRREFAETVDLCRNRRRDYFLALRFAWPELPAGNYTLQLEVRDGLTGYTGTRSIEFQLASQ